MNSTETLHPNMAILQQFNPNDPSSLSEILAEDAVFHYYNRELPELHGDYEGYAGFQRFFKTIGAMTKGSFTANPQSIKAYGDELVVTHTKNTMALGDKAFVVDAVVVWRIVDGMIKEGWDIPAINTIKTIDT